MHDHRDLGVEDLEPRRACATAFLIARSRRSRDPIRAMGPHALMGCSILGLEASIAAFEEGGPWREALLAVLARNRDTVVRELARFAPRDRGRAARRDLSRLA